MYRAHSILNCSIKSQKLIKSSGRVAGATNGVAILPYIQEILSFTLFAEFELKKYHPSLARKKRTNGTSHFAYFHILAELFMASMPSASVQPVERQRVMQRCGSPPSVISALRLSVYAISTSFHRPPMVVKYTAASVDRAKKAPAVFLLLERLHYFVCFE